MDRLKQNAARENRTLNDYVESVLLDIVYDEPNEVTKAAIKEAMSGKTAIRFTATLMRCSMSLEPANPENSGFKLPELSLNSFCIVRNRCQGIIHPSYSL